MWLSGNGHRHLHHSIFVYKCFSSYLPNSRNTTHDQKQHSSSPDNHRRIQRTNKLVFVGLPYLIFSVKAVYIHILRFLIRIVFVMSFHSFFSFSSISYHFKFLSKFHRAGVYRQRQQIYSYTFFPGCNSLFNEQAPRGAFANWLYRTQLSFYLNW